MNALTLDQVQKKIEGFFQEDDYKSKTRSFLTSTTIKFQPFDLQFLEHVDKTTFSFGVFYLLQELTKYLNDFSPLVPYIHQFLRKFNPHELQSERTQFQLWLCELLSLNLNFSVPIINGAIERLFGKHITNIHPALFKYIIQTRQFSLARPLLSATIHPKLNLVRVESAFEYYYYGAVILCHLKQFEKAFCFLYYAFVVPLPDFTLYFVPVYKYYLFTSLLVFHKTMPLPQTIGFKPSHFNSDELHVYSQIASLFESNNTQLFQRELSSFVAQLEKDEMIHLVEDLIDSLRFAQIKELTRIYTSKSIDFILEHCGFPTAQDGRQQLLLLLTQWISKGLLNARIDGEKVLFLSKAIARIASLENYIERMDSLLGDIRSFQRRTRLSKKNLAQTQEEQRITFTTRSHYSDDDDLSGTSSFNELLGVRK